MALTRLKAIHGNYAFSCPAVEDLPAEAPNGSWARVNGALYIFFEYEWKNFGGATGDQGPQGFSAYEVAVLEGFEGSVGEWLASLVGADGAAGADGLPGSDGDPGLSAYEIAVLDGFEGTEVEWLASLVGPEGPPGTAAGEIPVGGIILWSGTIAAIPSPTWELCDGTANSPGPDLRDTFVVGAKQDHAGVAKTNIEGSLKQTGGVTGHSHSGHANLTHAGMTMGDHTGLSHSVAIANHPDLTHAALSHAASTFSHADHSIPSVSHTHGALTLTHADHSVAAKSATIGAITLTHPDHSVASANAAVAAATLTHADHSIASANAAVAAFTLTHADHSIASHANITVPSHSHATTTVAIPSVAGVLTTATAATRGTIGSLTGNVSGISFAAIGGATIAAATYTHADHSVAARSGTIAAITVTHADHSVAAHSGTIAAITLTHPDHSVASANAALAAFTLTHPDHSVASFSGTDAARTLTHADHSFPSLSHQAIGTHVGTDYGVHNITQPADHGTAGTLTHAFSEPNDHAISAHDTVLSLPTYFALAYIQRMA